MMIQSMTRLAYKHQMIHRLTDMQRMVHSVVFIRHGESVWNIAQRFTGWCDVPLTYQGELDAKDAGNLIGQRNIKFDVAFTSNLERAWRTCAIALSTAEQSSVEVIRSWKLNERHYGALQGHSKNSEILKKAFGSEKLLQWRRSFEMAPPSMYDVDILKMIGPDALTTCTSLMDRKYLDEDTFVKTQFALLSKTSTESLPIENGFYPSTESLAQCQQRALSFWNEVIVPRVKGGERVLIVAHANTIRALVKAIDKIDDKMIAHLKIPNGVPLVYTLDDNLEPVLDYTDDLGFQAKYLVSPRNHRKSMEYERCVRKKLRNLFEYLDTDGDGKITMDCLINGINKIQNYGLNSSKNNRNDERFQVIDPGNAILSLTTPPGNDSMVGGWFAIDMEKDNPKSFETFQISQPQSKEIQNILNKNFQNVNEVGIHQINSNNYPDDPLKILKEQQQFVDVCEYEVEEMIRCLPSSDANGISLQEFLDSEATLLPKLSKLRLLQ